MLARPVLEEEQEMQRLMNLCVDAKDGVHVVWEFRLPTGYMADYPALHCYAVVPANCSVNEFGVFASMCANATETALRDVAETELRTHKPLFLTEDLGSE